jgi:arginase
LWAAILAEQLRLISMPFHNGLRDVSMGSGPIRLANDEQFRAAIEAEGWALSDDEVEAVDERDPEIVRVIELIRRLADHVKQAAADNAFPLVLAGNCNSALGTTAGVGPEDLGVVWFDAHADFDDPDENTSGFFDVMGLAMLTGRGWRALRQTIRGHHPIPEQHVVLAAARDLEPYQRTRMNQSELKAVPGEIDPAIFEQSITDLAQHVSRVYLHVDLDALDIEVGRANRYSAPRGPTLARLLDCIRKTGDQVPIAAAAITAYDPAYDPDNRALGAARAVANQIATTARSQPRPRTG